LKRLFLLFLVQCQVVLIFAQNLVPNSSFEILDSCVEPFDGYFLMLQGWNTPTEGSPDLYSNCNTNVHTFHTPDNILGTQSPKSGDNYSGILTHSEIDAREYIQIQLIESLVIGKQYCVEFFVSIADSSAYASNNIGAYFSLLPISVNNATVLPNIPQINNLITNKLDNKYTWTKISGMFTANGGEKFMTIGNFNNDITTDTIDFSDPSIWINASYHYIEDVSVIDCENISINESKEDSFIIYPNPIIDLISIKMFNVNDIVSIELNNSLGISTKINYDKFAYNENTITIDLSDFTSGVYNLFIKTKKNTIINKIIINPKI
jgi:hypothetical protein